MTGRSGTEQRARPCLVGFRVTPAEHRQVRQDAERSGLPVASYLRRLWSVDHALSEDTP